MSIHFQKELKDKLDGYLAEQEVKLLKDNVLKIVLHCRDYIIDVPDGLIGRILRVPETWLSSERTHPLYCYAVKKMPPKEFFNKTTLIFGYFEMLSGQCH